jgi:hypothetical protein
VAELLGAGQREPLGQGVQAAAELDPLQQRLELQVDAGRGGRGAAHRLGPRSAIAGAGVAGRFGGWAGGRSRTAASPSRSMSHRSWSWHVWPRRAGP